MASEPNLEQALAFFETLFGFRTIGTVGDEPIQLQKASYAMAHIAATLGQGPSRRLPFIRQATDRLCRSRADRPIIRDAMEYIKAACEVVLRRLNELEETDGTPPVSD